MKISSVVLVLTAGLLLMGGCCNSPRVDNMPVEQVVQVEQTFHIETHADRLLLTLHSPGRVPLGKRKPRARIDIPKNRPVTDHCRLLLLTLADSPAIGNSFESTV